MSSSVAQALVYLKALNLSAPSSAQHLERFVVSSNIADSYLQEMLFHVGLAPLYKELFPQQYQSSDACALLQRKAYSTRV